MKNSKYRMGAGFLLATLPIFANLSGGTAYAEESKSKDVTEVAADDADLFNMSLQEVLDVEVSTASKLNVKRTKSPGNMVVITQDQIRRFGYRNVAEALQRVVGFLTSKLGANTFVGYRGLSPQSFTSNAKILVLIDGVRYNDWSYDTATLNERFPVDIESIDRIEVLKGAGSAIWGSNAMFAAVNVITKSSNSERADQVLFERGSNDRNKIYSSWGDETEGGFKYFASVSGTGEDGDVGAYYPAFDTPPDANGITREVYHQKGHRLNLKMEYGDFYSTVAYGYNDEFLGSGVDYLYGDGGSSDYHQIPLRAEVGYKSQIWEEQEGELVVRTNFSFDRFRNRFIFPNNDAPGNSFLNINRQTTQASSTEVRYSQNLLSNVKGLIGAEYTRLFNSEFDSSFAEYTPANEQLFDELGWQRDQLTAKSYFYDVMYTPIEEVSLFFGGRLDQFSGLDSVFGPRASLVVNPSDKTTLRLVYSRGLRNPSIAERFTPKDATSRIGAEKVNYYEAFVEQRIEDWLSVTSSVFYSNLSDSVDFASFEDGNQTYKNGSGNESRGIESEIRAHVDNNLDAYFNVTYAEARNKNGDTPIRSFPHTLARTGVTFGESKGVFVVSPELMFIGGTEATGGREFDPYVLANINVLSYPLANGFNVTASVYNVFDKDYARLFGSIPDNVDSERAVEAGREYRIQAKWDF